MAHFHIKKKNGRPYLYVREIARVNGKPKVVNQVYIGSPDKVASLVKGAATQEKSLGALKVEEFGALWAALQMDQDIDLAGIIDEVIPGDSKEKGPSIGEYFLFAVLNRMVDATSKNALSDWYRHTAIQQLRPVDIDALNSQRYWEKWDRVTPEALEEIARRFFARVWALEPSSPDCLLFDTTNYYTFMSSHTESELVRRGKNKASRHHLRQVGLGLMVARDSRLPLHYHVYPGNLHDSKVFGQVMEEMSQVAHRHHDTTGALTVVVDKGMNAESNYAWLDEQPHLHFVTSYSTYFADDLARTPQKRFTVLALERNARLLAKGEADDRLLGYRTTGEYWGKERVVVVTHNPVTSRKQAYRLDEKLELLRQELLKMRSLVKEGAAHWRDASVVRERYYRICERLHLPTDLYELEFSDEPGHLVMSFRKDAYRLARMRIKFGRNIIISDHLDWSTEDLVQASLDRWQVEDRFRQSNEDDLVSVLPLRHWTDDKIRCHLFTCVVAITYLRKLELRLEETGHKASASSAMRELRHLHSVLSLGDGKTKPIRRLENPTKTQANLLSALGYVIDRNGVLQRAI